MIKIFLFITTVIASTIAITGCNDGRYSGLRLWAPDDPDHGQICGIKDWETLKVIPVDTISDDDWDHTD